MSTLQIIPIYHKVFLFYFKFPFLYDPATRRFKTDGGKDLIYSFYLAECVVISCMVLAIIEVVNDIRYPENIGVLEILLIVVALILTVFNVTSTIALSIVKNEFVAFYNDLICQVELLDEVFAKRKPTKKLDKLTIILSIFIFLSAPMPLLFAIFCGYLTIHDSFAHLLYAWADAICPLNTYFACKSITFIVVTAYYGFVAFNDTAALVGGVINSAVIGNMLIDSVTKLARLSPSLYSIQIYQRFRILAKNLEAISALVASLLLSLGFGFTVTCNFVSVRMAGVIPMPFYLVFPIGSLLGMVGIRLLLPYGIACHENSSKLLVEWRTRLRLKRGNMRLEEKMGRMLIPIGIRVGSGEFSFFVLKKSTRSTYYMALMDYTVNALMA
ncbi:hypothetical protein Fcan01_18290 [Folsomia candida]|uniref:Odorant receptor n=1 Tax=Folsomia candida TaxID=158441 RepID=A0A226DR35_FOLCA|nr:hypothetical protein Fcan01_18290 [Folsomia candida]